MVKNKESYKTATECIAVVVAAVMLFSCISFNIGDWPSPYVYPNNNPAVNWCGAIGAFCAYYLTYFVGPGIIIVLAAVIAMLGAKIARREIGQIYLRCIGVALLAIAGSVSFFMLWPKSFYEFPSGSGGILGVAIAVFLKGNFGILGTVLLVAAMWAAGAILLADTLVLFVLKWLNIALVKSFALAGPAFEKLRENSGAFREIWQKIKPSRKTISQTQSIFESDSRIEGIASQTLPASADKNKKNVKVTSSAGPKQTNAYVPKSYEDYTLPPLDLLEEPEHSFEAVQKKVVKAKAASLESLLAEFNVIARVVAAETGPVITMFELELDPGIKVSQISNLANDMARALGAAAVRVVAPLPGKHTIGIEVPNNEKEKVRIKDLMNLSGGKSSRMKIPLFLGKDSSGDALVSDLTTMPHLLIAGTTGSGKSVCINSIVTSIMLTKRPDEIKVILVDPKMVEMTAFSAIPHLMCPIVTETARAAQILEWATLKMDERYAFLAEAGVKNVAGYNALGPEEVVRRFNPTCEEEEAKIPKRLPYVVIIIDELADMMMTGSKEVEAHIVRLAQKSRAVGIHLVLATQRPQATVVTGLIKSNLPTRISFRVAARMDSRIVLDQNGAETLLGQGDMLFLKPGTSDLVRSQGTFVDDFEIRRIVKHLKEIAEPQFHPELTQLNRISTSDAQKDEMFDAAVRVVLETKRGSVSLLQRRLSIGYARASRIIEMMAGAGILGQYKGSQAREVMMTLDEYEQLCARQNASDGSKYDDSDDNYEDDEPEEAIEEYEYVPGEDDF